MSSSATSVSPPLPSIDYHWTSDELRRITEAKKKAAAEKKRTEDEQTAAARRAGR